MIKRRVLIMMKKFMMLGTGCVLTLVMGIGCSSKPDPSPEETALITNKSNGGFVASDDFAIDGNGGEILGDPFGQPPLRPDGFEGTIDDGSVADLFQPVYFDFDQFAIGANERSKISAVADFLKSKSEARILIEGHCDWKGTPAYNKSLGDRRATSVRNFLIDHNIDPGRIDTASKGCEEANRVGSADDMRRDRKAKFLVLK